MDDKTLQSFCHEDVEILKHPFCYGKHIYASDGLILLRVVGSGFGEYKGDKGKFDKVISTFDKKFDNKWVDVTMPAPERGECSNCNGSGKVYTCPECDGRGSVSLENDYSLYDDLDCGTCFGDGVITPQNARQLTKVKLMDGDALRCRDCGGDGLVDKIIPIKYKQVYFSSLLISKIAELKDCRIHTFGKIEPAIFRFDGGDGIIAPLDMDKE